VTRFSTTHQEIWQKVAALIHSDGRPWMLGGGTGLAEYLDHRDSEDIDLFLHQDFDAEALARWLQGHNVLVTAIEINTVKGYLDSTKIEFLGIPELQLLEPPTVIRGIPVMAPIDILATKIHAITHRAKLRDYVDLMESDRSELLRLEAIIEAAITKYNVINPNGLVSQVNRTLLYLDDIDEDPIGNYAKEAVAKYWEQRLKELPLGFVL